jgi:DNA polymerase-1
VTTLLIDGDELLFKAAAAGEQNTEWEPNVWTKHLDVAAAWDVVRSKVKHLMHKFGTSRVVFAMTGPNNWRKDVLPSYKANRQASQKPVGYEALRELALGHHAAIMIPRLEADDIIGCKATNPRLGDTIMVSSDKDFQSIPGTLYNPSRDTLVETSREDADLYHLMQTLTGDPSDGYKGCPGIGPKKAEAILDCDPADRWTAIVRAYEKAKLTEEDALVQAQVARILRHGEYHPPTSTVHLWLPTATPTATPR